MAMLSGNHGPSAQAAGGRRGARQPLAAAAWVLLGVAAVPAMAASEPQVTVREDRGSYVVAATFEVSQRRSTVVDVLTDYEEIPRFMPNMRTSIVLERGGGRTVVEQEAVARVMMFSKRIHLVLEVHQTSDAITFRDRCGRSFDGYEGSWTITQTDGGTSVAYRLTAKPSFDLPDFLVKRLLKRDSIQMIESLRAEIAARPHPIATWPRSPRWPGT